MKRLQFSLRTVLLLITGAAVLVSVVGAWQRRYRRDLSAIRSVARSAGITGRMNWPFDRGRTYMDDEAGFAPITFTRLYVLERAQADDAREMLRLRNDNEAFLDIGDLSLQCDAESEEVVAAFAAWPDLRSLGIRCGPSKRFPFEVAARHSPRLRHLSVCHAKPHERLISRIVAAFPGLRSLQLTNCELTNDDWNALQRLTGLTALQIARSPGVADERTFQAIAAIPRLEFLNVADSPIDPTALSELRSASHLTQVALVGSDVEIEVALACLELRQLRRLYVGGRDPTPPAAAVEEWLAKFPHLEFVGNTMGICWFRDDEARRRASTAWWWIDRRRDADSGD
jgi:hypothetical protein